MRTLVLLLALLTLPLQAQTRVFRASSIDLEQNERLDAVESRLAKLEKTTLSGLVPKGSSFEAAALTKRPLQNQQPVQAIAKPQPAAQAAPQPVSARYMTDELRAMIHARRPGGWRGAVYADVQPRSLVKQHLMGAEHGFSWDQVAGLTHNEALILHDLAPRHGNQIFPTRSQQTAKATPSVQAPVQQYARYGVPSSNAGCANGQCARQPVQSNFPRRLLRIFR